MIALGVGSLGVVADGPVGGSGVWEWEGVGRTLARHFSGTPRAGNAGNGLGASGDDEAQGGHLPPESCVLTRPGGEALACLLAGQREHFYRLKGFSD